MSYVEIFSLLGGVGLFLLGMTVMSTGLKNACGENLQTILEHATKNKITAVLVGLGMTMLIQSSSATDVMVIGFVNSGMMQLSQAIGVIMGANIGTTITAQITAFNLSNYTPLLLCGGAVMYLFLKNNFLKHVGSIIMGFGMLFQGITIMKAAIAPLSESQGFISFLSGLSSPALAFLFGIGFTALLQSSSSSIVIFQAFAVQGLLDYNTAVYLVIGAAIGSVTPNILASLTANRDGKRVAILNLLFNCIRAAILMVLINVFPVILTLIQSMSPGDIGRQIANTHTIFAIIAVLIELPFANRLIHLSQKIIPVLPAEHEKLEDRKLKYMTQLSNVPASVAVAQAHREVCRMGEIAAKNLKRGLDCFFDYTPEKAESVRSHEETVDILNRSIADAMTALGNLDLSPALMDRVSNLDIAITDIERLSDHGENIVEYIERMNSRHTTMTPEAIADLKSMAKNSTDTVDLALYIFSTEDYSKLDEIERIEAKVDEQQVELINNHIERIMNNQCSALAGIVFSDLVTDLERSADHAINLAYALKDRPADLHKIPN